MSSPIIVAARWFISSMGIGLLGCGGLVPAADGDPNLMDGAQRDSSLVDAALPACNMSAEFGIPQKVRELNESAFQEGARITPSGLELYLTREDPDNFKQIRHYTRASLQSPWSFDRTEDQLSVPLTGSDLDPPNGRAASGYMSFRSETFAYLGVLQEGGSAVNPASKIFTTTRSGPNMPWGVPVAAGINASTASTDFPWYNSKNARLYFASGELGSRHISVASVVGELIQSPEALQIDTLFPPLQGVSEYQPVLDGDGSHMYFTGTPGRNVFSTTARAKTLFNTPIPEPGLNVATRNQVSWLSPDGCEIYLTIEDMGSSLIYKARRPN
jgi:Tfp pilus assembly protein PilP